MAKGTRRNRRASRASKRSRRNRGASRRTTRRVRKQRGGAGPVGVYNLGVMSDSQGAEYQRIHSMQHGGMAPVGYTGVLDGAAERASARVDVLDNAFNEIQGLRDPGQVGGRRRGRKGRKGKSRKSKSRKTRGRKSRRGVMNGGAYVDPSDLSYGSASGPGMLLPSNLAARAGLNPEWKLAENPASFAPAMRG